MGQRQLDGVLTYAVRWATGISAARTSGCKKNIYLWISIYLFFQTTRRHDL